jgi:aromatic ring-cleaving dioxygenase
MRCWSLERPAYHGLLASLAAKKRAQYESFLKNIPLFSPCSKWDLLRIVDALQPVIYRPGEVIIRQGEPGDFFYIVVEGEVRMTKMLEDGNTVEVGQLGPSKYFGERALLGNLPRACTVTAISLVRCVRVNRLGFDMIVGSVKLAPLSNGGGAAVSATCPPLASEELVDEYHIHTYFDEHNAASRAAAMEIRSKLEDLLRSGRFPIQLGRVNDGPRGPHPIGSFETWVPAEALGDVLGWFMLHRGALSVMLHPLTTREVLDHTTRAMWLGQVLPLDLTCLSEQLPKIPSQRPTNGR